MEVQSQFIEMFGGGKYDNSALDDLCLEWIKGQTFKKEYLLESGDNKCIHYGELFTKYGPIINKVFSYTNEAVVKSSKAGDILFPASDVTPDGLARCSAIMEDNVLLGGDIIALRPNNLISPKYLSWATNMQKDQLLKRVTGSVVRHISAKGLKTVEIPVPPVTLQEKFVSIAEQADKSKFVGFKSQFIEMYHSTHNKQTLESVCYVMCKGITPKYVDSSSVIVINQACVHWDAQRLENVKFHNENVPVKKRKLETGDVLLNATGNGTLGRCCVFSCPSDDNSYINDGHVIALVTDRSVLLPEVLCSYLSLKDTQDEIYRQYVTGSTNQVDIVFTDIKKIEIPVPNMNDQQQFVSILKQADKSKLTGHCLICVLNKGISKLIN